VEAEVDMRSTPAARLPTLAVAAAIASGCALTTETIRIGYPEPVGVARFPGAGAIRVKLAVVDQRPDKSLVVSHKINSLGTQMAEISSEEAVPAVLERAVASELRARGCQVDAAGEVPVTIELGVFSHRFQGGFLSLPSEGTVSFSATVRDADGRELFRDAFSGVSRDNVQIAGGANAREALERALLEAVRKLMDSAAFQAALAHGRAGPAS
jgi:uncharacterized lipoprotein YajG